GRNSLGATELTPICDPPQRNLGAMRLAARRIRLEVRRPTERLDTTEPMDGIPFYGGSISRSTLDLPTFASDTVSEPFRPILLLKSSGIRRTTPRPLAESFR